MAKKTKINITLNVPSVLEKYNDDFIWLRFQTLMEGSELDLPHPDYDDEFVSCVVTSVTMTVPGS